MTGPFKLRIFIDRYDEFQDTHNDDTGIEPVEVGTFDKLSEAVEYRDTLMLSFGASQIAVDYDLLDKQIKSLNEAIPLHSDEPEVEHLRGLYELLCVIYEQRPFPAGPEKPETKGESDA